MYRRLSKKIVSLFLCCAVLGTAVDAARAAELLASQGVLPLLSDAVALTPAFSPTLLKGVRINPRDPLRLDFMIDGDGDSAPLIKYFLTGLTVPAHDWWVNLSPFEKDRVVPEVLGQTLTGQELLSQDYILKQITAALLHPDSDTGKLFWSEVYRRAAAESGVAVSDIPMDALNKVWIIPDEAVVYENAAAGAAYVAHARLKVMVEEDYHAVVLTSEVRQKAASTSEVDQRRAERRKCQDVLREVVIPVLEKEVNEGKNFAPLRQVYYSLILSAWFKRRVHNLLSSVYVDENKAAGVHGHDPKAPEKIWARYASSFQKGAYNLIREETDAQTGDIIPRKYFSGGFLFGKSLDAAMRILPAPADFAADPAGSGKKAVVSVELIGAESGLAAGLTDERAWLMKGYLRQAILGMVEAMGSRDAGIRRGGAKGITMLARLGFVTREDIPEDLVKRLVNMLIDRNSAYFFDYKFFTDIVEPLVELRLIRNGEMSAVVSLLTRGLTHPGTLPRISPEENFRIVQVLARHGFVGEFELKNIGKTFESAVMREGLSGASPIDLEFALFYQMANEENLSQFLPDVMGGLQKSDPFLRRKSLKNLRALSEAGLADSRDISPDALKSLTDCFSDPEEDIREDLRGLVQEGVLSARDMSRSIPRLIRLAQLDEGAGGYRIMAVSKLAFLAEENLILPEHIRIILDIFLKGLKSSESYLEMSSAQGIKALVLSGHMSRDEVAPGFLSQLLENLVHKNSRIRLDSALGLKFLAEAGIVRSADIPDEKNKTLKDALLDGNIYSRGISAEILKILSLAKLLKVSESSSGDIPLEALIDGIGNLESEVQVRSAEALKSLAEAGLVSAQDIPWPKIKFLLERLTDRDPDIQTSALFAFCALSQAGLIRADGMKQAQWQEVFRNPSRMPASEEFRRIVAWNYFLSNFRIKPEGAWQLAQAIPVEALTPQGIMGFEVEALMKSSEVCRRWAEAIVRGIRYAGVLRRIRFEDGSNAVAPALADMMKSVFSLVDPGYSAETIPDLPQPRPLYAGEHTDGSILEVDGVMIDLSKPDKQFGRTLVFYRKDLGRAFYVKLLKQGENAGNLIYEHDMMNFMRENKEAWGLMGDYPRGLVRQKSVDVGSVKFRRVEGADAPIILANHQGRYYFMVYEASLSHDGKDVYGTYLNDPWIGLDRFLNALRVNIHDRMVMARRGLFDLEVIELFHNQEHGDGRRYDWMVDMEHHSDDRSGAGRLNDFVGATRFPNLRLSGPADLTAMRHMNDILLDGDSRYLADDRIARLMDMVGDDVNKARPYVTAALLGDTLLSFVLVTATYFLRRGELDYEREASGVDTPLQRALGIIFDEAYRAYRGRAEIFDADRLWDIRLMARQIAYFMTDRYKEDFDQRNPIPAEVFPGTIVGMIQAGRGWSHNGWNVRKKVYPMPSQNPRAKEKMSSRDLGPVNGPNPLQKLIEALYVSTTVMVSGVLEKKESGSEPSGAASVSDAAEKGGVDFGLISERLDIRPAGVPRLMDIDARVFAAYDAAAGFVPCILHSFPLSGPAEFIAVQQ